MNAENWKAKGKFVEVNGRNLFVVEEGDPNKPTLLILHGYPSCSFDYYKVLPILSKKYRVIVHDHFGFGFSDKPVEYSYSIIDQADTALSLWRKLGIKEAFILAHDYGSSVLTEIVAKWNLGYRPVDINAIIFGNGSILINRVKLLFAQKILMNKKLGPILTKLSTESYFQYNLKKIFYDKSKYSKEEIRILYEIGMTKEAKAVFPRISLYNHERKKFWNRWITNGIYNTDIPIKIYWADKDPIAVIDMAHELKKNIPTANLKIIKDVGHYPMLEAPVLWSETVLGLLVE